MKLVEARKLEDCIDGSMIFEFLFDGEIDEALMRRMAEGGELEFHPDFPRPFFRIRAVDSLQFRGILGDHGLEVLFPRGDGAERLAAFRARMGL